MFIEQIRKLKPYQYLSFIGILVLAGVGAYTLVSTNAMIDVSGVYNLKVSNVTVLPAEQNSGIKRVTVSISLQNVSKDVMQVSPGLQMLLTSDSGTTYNMTAKYLGSNVTIGGPLASGSSVNLLVDYEIPSVEKPKTFIFQPDNSIPATEIGL